MTRTVARRKRHNRNRGTKAARNHRRRAEEGGQSNKAMKNNGPHSRVFANTGHRRWHTPQASTKLQRRKPWIAQTGSG